ncbi:hypothetical protein ACI3K4_27840 [Streptomyces sp. CSMPJR101]|uniref:hypothetical protein n=1 Tax=Streptomyces sp. CSMPJR101 TaxID=1279378 RepID=UPI003852F7D8
MTSFLPRLRGNGVHRADDRIAELEARHAGELQQLRDEMDLLRSDNIKLLNRQAAADDFFAILRHDVVTANKAWVGERTRRENAEKALVQAENAIRLRDRRISDLNRKIDVGVKAEHVIAQTQEIPVITPVIPLHEAPFATTDPGRVRPSWAEPDPAA